MCAFVLTLGSLLLSYRGGIFVNGELTLAEFKEKVGSIINRIISRFHRYNHQKRKRYTIVCPHLRWDNPRLCSWIISTYRRTDQGITLYVYCGCNCERVWERATDYAKYLTYNFLPPLPTLARNWLMMCKVYTDVGGIK